MMLADPRLVIVEAVEVKQQIHIAIEREQRIFMERMKGCKENPAFHIPVAGIGHGHAFPTTSTCRRRGPCAPRIKICPISAEREGPVIMLMARGSVSVPNVWRTRCHTVS